MRTRWDRLKLAWWRWHLCGLLLDRGYVDTSSEAWSLSGEAYWVDYYDSGASPLAAVLDDVSYGS